MTLWKSECENGHTSTSSVGVSRCPFCSAEFVACAEITMTPLGISTRDVLKKKKKKKKKKKTKKKKKKKLI